MSARRLPPIKKPRTWEQVLKVFWSQVEKTETCWLWRGNVLDIRNPKKHYGSIEWKGKRLFTHRLAWQITHGEIPTGFQVLHFCDTPRCVNPFHLFLGTHKENLEDCTRKGRRSRLVGDRHPMVKLNESQVREIRRLAQTETGAEIARIMEHRTKLFEML